MDKKQVLLRLDDSLYYELLNGAKACKMSIQQYMIFLLGDEANRIKNIEREVGNTNDDLHTLMINERLAFANIKKMQRELYKLSYYIALNNRVEVEKEDTDDAEELVDGFENEALKRVSEDGDIYSMEKFLKLLDDNDEFDNENSTDSYDEDAERIDAEIDEN